MGYLPIFTVSTGAGFLPSTVLQCIPVLGKKKTVLDWVLANKCLYFTTFDSSNYIDVVWVGGPFLPPNQFLTISTCDFFPPEIALAAAKEGGFGRQDLCSLRCCPHIKWNLKRHTARSREKDVFKLQKNWLLNLGVFKNRGTPKWMVYNEKA